MTSEIQPKNLLLATLPSDLRALGDESILLKITLQAVVDTAFVRPLSSASGQIPLSIPMMLTLVTYSYACGIYGSRDIESAIYKERTLRYICARQYPTWKEIRRFRRLHRDLLQKTLGSLLRQFCLQFLFPLRPTLAANLPPFLLDEQIGTVVAARIETAIIMDGVEADV